MLITVAQLEAFTGRVGSSDEVQQGLSELYIKSAQAEIIDYLGYNPEDNTDEHAAGLSEYSLAKIQNVCLEIAALIAMENNNNLGVASSSGAGMVGHSFLNVVDYSRYLAKLSAYRAKTEAV